MRHSVIRRSLGVVAIVLLGHCFNYLFVLLANRSVDAATFGRFYAAWATINVLGTPSAVFALLLTRYYAEAALSNSELSVWNALKHAGRVLTPWVIGAAVVVEIGLLLAGASVSDSIALIAVLPLIAAVGFGIEAVRAAYAATHHPYLFAGFFFVRCILECALGLTGLLLLKSVWGAYLGVLIGSTIIFLSQLGLTRAIMGGSRAQLQTAEPPARLQLSDALPFCTAYVGFVILNNADVLVAYFVLKASQLGVYSAAAVLPKAIVTATQPIAQILLPILIAVKGQTLLTRNAVYKAIAVTAVMGIAGFAALWLGSGVVCGSRVGIRFCEPNLMLILATAAVMLAVVRTAMTVDLGYRLYYLAHLPFLGFVAFVIFELIVRPMPYALAGSYALASACILGIFGLLSIIRSQFRGAVPAPQSTT